MDMSAVTREADQGLHAVLSELYQSPNMPRERERATLLHNVHSLYAELAKQRHRLAQRQQNEIVLEQTIGQLQQVIGGHLAEKKALFAKISKLTSQRDVLASQERDLRMDKGLCLTEISALRSQLEVFRRQRDGVPAAELAETNMVPLSAKAVSDPSSLVALHLLDPPFGGAGRGQWIPPVRLSIRDSPCHEYSPEEMAIIKRRMQTDRGPNRRPPCGGDAKLAGEDPSTSNPGGQLSPETSSVPLRHSSVQEEADPRRFSTEGNCPQLASNDEGDNGHATDHTVPSRSSPPLSHSFVQPEGDTDAMELDSTVSESAVEGGCASEDIETDSESQQMPSPVRQLETTTTASVAVESPDKQLANPVDGDDVGPDNMRELQVGLVLPKPINAAPVERENVMSGSVLREVKIEHDAQVDVGYYDIANIEDPKTAAFRRRTPSLDSRAAPAPCFPGTDALDAQGSALTPGGAVGDASHGDVAPVTVKSEEVPVSTAETFPSEATEVTPPSPPPQSCRRFSHRLYWRDQSARNSDVPGSSEDSDKASSNKSRGTSEERAATGADGGEDKTGSVNREVSPVCDTYLHVTYCSWCSIHHTETQAVALCALCPRMCCRDCLLDRGENAPSTGSVVLPSSKCLCLRWDSHFPKPPEGVQPEAHLLQQLVAHDLSLLFREEVNSLENPGYIGVITREEMMDLSTMEKKMNKIQYRTTRGRRMFRKDLKQIWLNCWKYAGYAPGSNAPVPGIVSCTLILEAMVDAFYKAYIQEPSLAVDEKSWHFLDERNKQQQFTQMVHGMPARMEKGQSPVGPVEPFVVADAETYDDDPGEETETDDEAEMGDIHWRMNLEERCYDATADKRSLSDEVAAAAAGVRDSCGGDVDSQPTQPANGGDGGRSEMVVASRVNGELSRAANGLSQSLCEMADVGEEMAVFNGI